MDGRLLDPTLNLKAAESELNGLDARWMAHGQIASCSADIALSIPFHGGFIQVA